MTAEIRPVAEAEFAAWLRTVQTAFLNSPVVTDGDLAQRLKYTDLSRTTGAYDADSGRCVGTFRTFAQELTVPGGAVLPSSAVTNVTVLPTHRRQGLLTRMMAAGLAEAEERGDAFATLIAAEYPIYGRYGFGPAAGLVEWEIDVPRTGLDPRWSGPGDGGRIELVDTAEAGRFAPELHERLRRSAGGAGMVSRNERFWNLALGLERMDFRPYREQYFAVYRSADGEVQGIVAYRSDDHWTDAKVPLNTVQVNELLAVTPAAERALWHYLCSIDWVMKVRTGYRAPDDLLPELLPDPRAARTVTAADQLWVRVLDVVRVLRARTYDVPGELVLEVEDPDGPAGGRYRLDAGARHCVRTDDAPDLTLGVSELGSLCLGDASVTRLVALGGVREHRAGAAALADPVFRTARRPWCPDIF
ncbi:GNAT family N-acetyltransferase [Streptomyces sp. NPDC089799]|uniref:GNAT family N-acetyltransferase n=1 Tax=Streptomyces sp. NPDC089799 TaxID=3155066 RepID=UPI00342DDE86